MCPEIILAPNLNPKETLRARYEINSISTNSGNNANGQPAGTNNEKKCSPCFWKPNIVAPSTIVKLKEKVKIKWLVEAKLYGIIPIKLFIKINTNKAYIKGKYFCPFVAFIWFTTIPCTVAYIVSKLTDQLLDTILFWLVANVLNKSVIRKAITRYNPMFVKDKCRLANTGRSRLTKSLISNWSSGLVLMLNVMKLVFIVWIYYLYTWRATFFITIS